MDDPKAILNAYVDDELTEDQHRELVAWIRQAPGNIDRFIAECYLHSQLQDIFSEEQVARDVTALQAVPNSPPLINVVQGPVSYFSQGWPLAYLLAIVFLGLGLLVGSVVPVSPPAQFAGQSPSPAAQRRLGQEPQKEFVGRITGMVDCQWADDSSTALNGAHVPLERKYTLASGLLEITYDTGAKVILQGPVTYEVESRSSGFLSIGKLTARLEKAEDRRPKTEDLPASSSAFLVPHSSFAIRTPTATVTDLGTEFGVEVSKSGETVSHVFRGSVRLQVASVDGEPRLPPGSCTRTNRPAWKTAAAIVW